MQPSDKEETRASLGLEQAAGVTVGSSKQGRCWLLFIFVLFRERELWKDCANKTTSAENIFVSAHQVPIPRDPEFWLEGVKL